jgi:hypothetical protein
MNSLSIDYDKDIFVNCFYFNFFVYFLQQKFRGQANVTFAHQLPTLKFRTKKKSIFWTQPTHTIVLGAYILAQVYFK